MTLKPILAFAHALLEDALRPGDIAIDCTMGNGRDTLFLADLVGESGHVFAFDIQETAIENTRGRLAQHDIAAERVTLLKESHANLLQQIPARSCQKIKAAVFNLGYLPGGDKRICTRPHSTIAALEGLRSILAPGGIVVLVIYPGHDGGEAEALAVLDYCKALPREEVQVIVYQILNNPKHPPFVIALEKINDEERRQNGTKICTGLNRHE